MRDYSIAMCLMFSFVNAGFREHATTQVQYVIGRNIGVVHNTCRVKEYDEVLTVSPSK